MKTDIQLQESNEKRTQKLFQVPIKIKDLFFNKLTLCYDREL